GYGAPLGCHTKGVVDDVIDGCTSIARAQKDYGVVITQLDAELDQYEIDFAASEQARERIQNHRQSWLEEAPEKVAQWYREGLITQHDSVRQYGVILDWGTGELLPKTTDQYRESMQRRSAAYWK